MALVSISALPEVDKLFGRPQKSFVNGTHAVVLEVDPDTGAARVLRWIVAHDCGHVLEPGIVDGQIHGAVMQGLPDALNVQLAYDEGGQRPPPASWTTCWRPRPTPRRPSSCATWSRPPAEPARGQGRRRGRDHGGCIR